MTQNRFDAIIIGSGFGGSMSAKKLTEAGWKVLMLEKGDWVKRGLHNWATNGSIDLTSNYDKSLPYKVLKGGNKKLMGSYSAVGGPSVFYGGVSFRFREQDFKPKKELLGESNAEWPIDYNDLEPYYDEAESILNVAGEMGVDPTEPNRTIPFPQEPAPYADISKKIKKAAESLNLKPFHLPLAINYSNTTDGQKSCQLCTTCDTFACAVRAKNDLDTVILRKIPQDRLQILANRVVTEITAENGKAKTVKCYSKDHEKIEEYTADVIILSAGALGSPHIVLNSGLEKLNPSGHLIGKYLMRHTNSIVFGIYPRTADKQQRFHKELAIMDYYFGHPDYQDKYSKIGSIQQVPTPPSGLVEHEAPRFTGKVAGKLVKLLTGLLVIAEDQPQISNFIDIDRSKRSTYGMYQPIVSHEYSRRDLETEKILTKEAKKIMKKAGALSTYTHPIRTFSHSAGTMRMGNEPTTSPLDSHCSFRGLDNLYVIDACFMPTSAAVNPSLTISANALRVANYIIEKHKPLVS